MLSDPRSGGHEILRALGSGSSHAKGPLRLANPADCRSVESPSNAATVLITLLNKMQNGTWPQYIHPKNLKHRSDVVALSGVAYVAEIVPPDNTLSITE
jgi:hypothetical protein